MIKAFVQVILTLFKFQVSFLTFSACWDASSDSGNEELLKKTGELDSKLEEAKAEQASERKKVCFFGQFSQFSSGEQC